MLKKLPPICLAASIGFAPAAFAPMAAIAADAPAMSVSAGQVEASAPTQFSQKYKSKKARLKAKQKLHSGPDAPAVAAMPDK